MKLIKSFFLLTVGFCTTTILYAQELKPEIAKPVEIKTLPATADNRPSPLPELKPQTGPVPTATSPTAVAEKQSAVKEEEPKKPAEEAKAVALAIDAGGATKKLTDEQLKILNGVSERPTVTASVPNTIDNSVRPVPVKPAISKVQQQQ